MPRFGFAYDVAGNAKTVVRGGAGIFYQDRMPGFFNLNQAGNVPNTIAVGLNNLGMIGAAGPGPGGPFSNPYCQGGCGVKGTPYDNPFPFTLPFPSNKPFPNAFLVDEYDPSGNFSVPVTYAFNLTLERQLTSVGRCGWLMPVPGRAISHQPGDQPVGKHRLGTEHQPAARCIIRLPSLDHALPARGCKTSYAQIVEAYMAGNANFNSLQATLDKKMSHGLSLLAKLHLVQIVRRHAASHQSQQYRGSERGSVICVSSLSPGRDRDTGGGVCFRHQGAGPRLVGHRSPHRAIDFLRVGPAQIAQRKFGPQVRLRTDGSCPG